MTIQQSNNAWWHIMAATVIFNTFNEVFLKDSSHLEGEALEWASLIMPKHVKSGRRTWKDIEKKETHLPGDPNSGEPGSVPGRGTRSHRPQPGVHRPQLKMLCTRTKTQCSQTNEEIFFKNYLIKQNASWKLRYKTQIIAMAQLLLPLSGIMKRLFSKQQMYVS